MCTQWLPLYIKEWNGECTHDVIWVAYSMKYKNETFFFEKMCQDFEF